MFTRGTRRVSANGRVRRRHIRSRPGRLSSMVKAAAGLQQKRQSKQAALRSTRDFEKSQKQKQQAAKSGVTLEIARQQNIEKAAAAAERKAIKKEKRERRKEAKARVKDAKNIRAVHEAQAREDMLVDKEREQRRAAAAAAAAARAKQEEEAARRLAGAVK